uniref:Thioredoxin_12 domain-containing protein n=1 Tax=Angiostrongylus cantonensis TaxID=6313 RepID=A0A0K0DP68_ANGCA
LVSEASVDLLKLSLSLRVFSPAVQLFQKPLSGCFKENGKSCCFKIISAEATYYLCIRVYLLVRKHFQLRDAPELLSIDHVFDVGKEADVIVVVYGEIGSKPWLRLHEKAVELANAQKLRYVFRHYSVVSDCKVSLSGYGVELAIKNTEYKAVDDSNEKKEERDEDNLHGFNFKLLKELHPGSSDSLDAFKMHLREIQELAPLKQWQVQDLSFKVISTKCRWGSVFLSSTLSTFYNVRSFSRVITCAFCAGLEAGESALFLNGINLDIDSLDAFQLVDVIKQEERVSTGFFNMGIKVCDFVIPDFLCPHVYTLCEYIIYAYTYIHMCPLIGLFLPRGWEVFLDVELRYAAGESSCQQCLPS